MALILKKIASNTITKIPSGEVIYVFMLQCFLKSCAGCFNAVDVGIFHTAEYGRRTPEIFWPNNIAHQEKSDVYKKKGNAKFSSNFCCT